MLDDTTPPLSSALDDPRPEVIDSDECYGPEDAGSEFDDVQMPDIDRVPSHISATGLILLRSLGRQIEHGGAATYS